MGVRGMGFRCRNGPSRNSPPFEGRLASRTPRSHQDNTFRFFPEQPLLCLLFWSFSIYFPISLPLFCFSYFFFLHSSSTCGIHCSFQPVNVRSASWPSTRCTCSEISLFLHCSILDSLSVPLSSSASPIAFSFINMLKKILSYYNSFLSR